MRTALIVETLASAHDCTQMKSVTGVTIDANIPDGCEAAFAVKIGSGAWKMYKDGWQKLATQKLTATSLLSEGNTQAQIEALSEDELEVMVGTTVYFAVALGISDANKAPSVTGINVTGLSQPIAYKKTVDSGVITLGDEEVTVTGFDVDKVESNGGTVDVFASLLSDGKWGEFINVKNISGENAQAVKLRASLVVTKIGGSVAKLNSVTVNHHESGNSAFAGERSCLVTIPFDFVNEISELHLLVKHKNVADNKLSAFVALRKAPSRVTGEVIATGAGRLQIASLAHTDKLANHDFALYFDGEKQESSTYYFSPADGQVTFDAPAGSVVTADYVYGFETEVWKQIDDDVTLPSRYDDTLTDSHFDLVTEEKGVVGNIMIVLERQSGTESDVQLGTGNGEQQVYVLAHKANPATIVVSGATDWSYYKASNKLVVTANVGTPVTVSYSWQGGADYIESIAFAVNR